MNAVGVGRAVAAPTNAQQRHPADNFELSGDGLETLIGHVCHDAGSVCVSPMIVTGRRWNCASSMIAMTAVS